MEYLGFILLGFFLGIPAGFMLFAWAVRHLVRKGIYTIVNEEGENVIK